MINPLLKKREAKMCESALVEQIARYKKEKNAVILAHYYVEPEVQSVADYIGDSFFLAKKAKELTNDCIVFCGVSFMGESAKCMNPEKTILMPDREADCPMAHMADKEEILRIKAENEDVAVVCYINSTAELKTYSDVCVTSSNAVRIVKSLPQKNIYFIPDKNLAHYIAQQVPEKHFIFNAGFCPTHEKLSLTILQQESARHPQALILSHPECRQEVLSASDYIGSTSEIIAFATKSPKKSFIICTEKGVRYPLRTQNPDKTFYFPRPEPVCPNMKKITLEKVLHVLKTGENAIELPETQRIQARIPLEEMMKRG
jgi:quinolinate synthase